MSRARRNLVTAGLIVAVLAIVTVVALELMRSTLLPWGIQ